MVSGEKVEIKIEKLMCANCRFITRWNSLEECPVCSNKKWYAIVADTPLRLPISSEHFPTFIELSN